MSKNIPTTPIEKCVACMTFAGAGQACINDLLKMGNISKTCTIAAYESYDWNANAKLCSDSCKNLTPEDNVKLEKYKPVLNTNFALPGSILNKFKSAYEDAKQCMLDMNNGGTTTSKACLSVTTYCNTLGCAEELSNLAANWNYPIS